MSSAISVGLKVVPDSSMYLMTSPAARVSRFLVHKDVRDLATSATLKCVRVRVCACARVLCVCACVRACLRVYACAAILYLNP